MTLLVTGGTGFVMSNVVRRWLLQEQRERAVIVDANTPDDLAKRFFSPVASRLDHIKADVLSNELWASLAGRSDIGYVVHGATVTSINRHVHADGHGKPGLAGAQRSIAVNIDGTVNVLAWAQSLPALQCLVNVSSGSVYADSDPAERPLPEEGYVAPEGIYAITKYTGELFTAFSAREFDLPAVSVRLSGVFGPMDRQTSARDVTCAPKAIALRALAGEVVRVRALEAAGDFIQAGDVAAAIIGLLEAGQRRHAVYNVAAGETATIDDLLTCTREKFPSLRYVLAGAGERDVDYDPAQRTGRWGAYDISRIRQDTGWSPRPLRDSLHAYLDWLTAMR